MFHAVERARGRKVRQSACPLGEVGMFKVSMPQQEGTWQVKRNRRLGRVVVTADVAGVVSHAGAGLLREMATETGLVGRGTAS